MIFRYMLPSKTVILDRTISDDEKEVYIIDKDSTGQLIKVKTDILIDSSKKPYINIENEKVYINDFIAPTWEDFKTNFDKKEELEIIKKELFISILKNKKKAMFLCSLKKQVGLGRENYTVSNIIYKEEEKDYEITLIPQNKELGTRDNKISFMLTELAENLKKNIVKIS